MANLSMTFEEAYETLGLTKCGTETRLWVTLRAIKLATSIEHIRTLHTNVNKNSLLDAVVFRQLAHPLPD